MPNEPVEADVSPALDRVPRAQSGRRRPPPVSNDTLPDEGPAALAVARRRLPSHTAGTERRADARAPSAVAGRRRMPASTTVRPRTKPKPGPPLVPRSDIEHGWAVPEASGGLAALRSPVGPGEFVKVESLKGRSDVRAVALADGGALSWGDGPTTAWFTPSAGGGAWRVGPQLPGPAFGAPGVRLGDDTVMIIGGNNGAQVWHWSPGQGAFEPLEPLKEARHEPALIPVGYDSVLVMGGMSPDGRPVSAIEGVTPRGHHVRGMLLRDRPDPIAARVGDLVVVLGAFEGPERPEVWSLVDGSATLGRPAPEPRKGADMIPVGRRILRAGGEVTISAAGPSLPEATHFYDPVADEWQLAGYLATARQRPKLARWGRDGAVLIGGAADRPEVVALVEAYDGRRWTRSAPLAVGRVDHAAVTLADGRILVVGGRTIGHLIPPYSEISRLP